MKVVVLGAKGMLGRDVAAACATRGAETVPMDIEEVDIVSCEDLLTHMPRADWVVNCAAYTQVDKAESEREQAYAVNANGARNVAECCRKRGARLVQVSTDYVFDGTADRAYREDDEPKPLNWYGRTKLDGERFVLEECEHGLIVRTQSLFGLHGRSFVDTIWRRLETSHEVLKVVSDQISAPTFTRHLADAILQLMDADKAGIVHVCSAGQCSWWEFARAIAEKVRPGAVIQPILAKDYPSAARRPAHSVLDTERYTLWTGRRMPTWQEALDAYCNERGAGTGSGDRQGGST